jgi:hypothetical protein
MGKPDMAHERRYGLPYLAALAPSPRTTSRAFRHSSQAALTRPVTEHFFNFISAWAPV